MFHDFQVNLGDVAQDLGWFWDDFLAILDDLGILRGEFSWFQTRADLVWFSDHVGVMMLDHFGADLGCWFPNHSFMNENVDKTADKWGPNMGI